MPRTPDTGEDRREQIIDAAIRVFAQKGFSRATNRDVAREAGITAGLIYYYFENKQALFKALLEERSPLQLTAQVTPQMLQQPPEVFLPMLIGRVLAIVEGEQFVAMLRVVLPEVLHHPEIAPFMSGLLQRVLGFLSSYLNAQIARDTVRADMQLDVVSQMLMGTLMTFVMRRQLLRDPHVLHYSHRELASLIVDTILQGIKAR
jgi:AcrR family transcriptional regulator